MPGRLRARSSSRMWKSVCQQTMSHPANAPFLCRTFSGATGFNKELFSFSSTISQLLCLLPQNINAGHPSRSQKGRPAPTPASLTLSIRKLTEVTSSICCGGSSSAEVTPGTEVLRAEKEWPLLLSGLICPGKGGHSGRRQQPWQLWAESLIWKQWADNTASP